MRVSTCVMGVIIHLERNNNRIGCVTSAVVCGQTAFGFCFALVAVVTSDGKQFTMQHTTTCCNTLGYVRVWCVVAMRAIRL